MSFVRRAMTYLGLVDDDYDEYDVYEEPPAQPVGRPARAVAPPEPEPTASVGAVRTLPREPVPEPSGVTMAPRSGAVRPLAPVHASKVHVVVATTFNDAPEVGDTLKNGQPVIVNLTTADRDIVRRLIDFCSGASYALDATMKQVAKGVFLITPSNVEVSAEEKKRLQERGLFRPAP